MKNRFGVLMAAFAILSVWPFFVRAEWAATFVAPVRSTMPLRIDLPDNLDLMKITTLAVELDGIDITALLELEGTDLVFLPVEPFSAGEHAVRLFDVSDPENIITKAEWSFAINTGAGTGATGPDGPTAEDIAATEAAMVKVNFRADTLTELSYRAIEKNLSNAPDRLILGGAGDISGDLSAGNWRMSSRVNYLLQSEKELSLTGERLDIGEYDITVDYAGENIKGGVIFGHQDIGQQSLLMNGFYRRGASARIGLADERISAQGFSFGTSSVSGVENLSGLNNARDRLVGGLATVKPFSSSIDALAVTGLYYDGKGAGIGDGILETNPVAEGEGWSAVVEKGFSNQRLKLRGEYARTFYDQDGIAGAAPKQESDGVSMSAEARVFEEPPLMFGQSVDLVIGGGYDRIGTYFQSLANTGIAADRDAYSAYSRFNWGAMSANLKYVYETNNVDNLAALATDRLQNLEADVNYSFAQQTDGLAWLGTPNIYVSGLIADMGRQDTPAGYLGPETNNVTTSLTIGGGSNYGSWFWGASHSYSSFNDRTNGSSDTVNNATSFNIGWTASERFAVNGNVQFNVFKDRDVGTTSYTTNVGADLSAALLPEVLNLNLDYNLNLATGSGVLPDTQLLNGEIEWTFLQPQADNVGLALAVGGSMENINGNANSSDDETAYQGFLVLRLKVPFDYSN